MNGLQSFVYVEDNQEHSTAFIRAFAQTRVSNEMIVLSEMERVREYFSSVANRKRDLPALTMVNLSFGGGVGTEVIGWIRSFAELKTIPAVALASTYDFDQLEQSYERGANLYLLKPRNIHEWADLVFRLQGYWSGQSEVTVPEIL